MSSGVHVLRFSLTALFGAVLFVAFGTAGAALGGGFGSLVRGRRDR